MSEDLIAAAVRIAMSTGLSESEATRAVRSGWKKGQATANPRPLPDFSAPARTHDASYTNGAAHLTGSAEGEAPPVDEGPSQGETQPPKAAKRQHTSTDYLDVLHGFGYRFEENLMTGAIEVNGAMLEDGQAALIRCQLRDLGYPQVTHAEDAYIAEAHHNRYHPVQRWLERLTWDGQDHIAALAGHFAVRQPPIAGEDAFKVWLRFWLVNAVGKVYGERQNVVLALDGAQNLGKSYFGRWLCPKPEWHSEESLDPHGRETPRLLSSKLVWELGEIGHITRRADAEALKLVLTQTAVTFRVPYARNNITRPALASFIGTFNNVAGFLTDPTGSRRFVALTIESIDHRYSCTVSLEQVWAQAHHCFRQGLFADRSEVMRQAQAEANEEYSVSDPYAAAIAGIIQITDNPFDYVPARALLGYLHGHGLREATPRGTEMAIGTACKGLGLARDRVTIDGVKQIVYRGARLR